jgi:NTE family protein
MNSRGLNKGGILNLRMIPPRQIVLSGGGIRVCSTVGVLKALEERKILRHVKHIGGVSAGAWLAFMVASGLKISVIQTLIHEIDFSIIRNITPDAFLGFPENYGIDDGSNLTKFLESVIRVTLHIDPKITFEQFQALKNTKMIFRCWATDLNDRKIKEFSADKTPNFKIIDALRASMALPLYFTPVVDPVTGHLLSDGALLGNLPIHHLMEDELGQTVGITFCNEQPETKPDNIQLDLFGFFGAIFNSLVQSRNEDVKRKYSHRIIEIPVGSFASWNFEATYDERKYLYDTGYNTGIKWLSNIRNGSHSISRRHSV